MPTSPNRHANLARVQNQIRSEEEFQAKKAKLREEAKLRLEGIMHRKNKRSEPRALACEPIGCRHDCVPIAPAHHHRPLPRPPPPPAPACPAVVWELEDEDDDWSVCSSELSAWDSDVDSVSSLVSCAEDWKERSAFPARAEAALKCACCAALVSGLAPLAAAMHGSRACAAAPRRCSWHTSLAHTPLLSTNLQAVVVGCMRVSWLSYAGSKQFWGVLDHRGTCLGTAAVSCLALLSAGLALQAWAGKSKRLLLAMQLSAHLLFASALATAVFAHTFPTRVNEQVRAGAAGGGSPRPSRLRSPARPDETGHPQLPATRRR
jgi:hypothetical protein